MEVTNKYVVTKHHINGAPSLSDFSISEELISLKKASQVSENDVLVKNLYVSIDPYQLNRMKSHSSSHNTVATAAAILPGQAIDGIGVGRVVGSDHPNFIEGDVVSGRLHWGEYTLVKGGRLLQKLDPASGFSLSYYAGGILGSSGLTAYAGFFHVCKPKKGNKVFVSAAAGSVGILVGQYAKLFGCYVVGCTGTKHKVELLKENFGLDDAFNYKEESNLNSALQRYFPKGIDIYFDNVGGEMLEAAIDNMNDFGRVAVCGVMSEYTNKEKKGRPDMLGVIYKRIKIEGFLMPDFLHIYQDFISTTMQHLQDGKIKPVEDISYGVDAIPTAFLDLFCGNNIGKKVVRIYED